MCRTLFALIVLASTYALASDSTVVRLIVAADGSAQFHSIQAALDDPAVSGSRDVIISVRNGLYQEKVFVKKSHVAIVGEEKDHTRIVFPVLRETWRATHNGSDWGAGVVNIDTGVTDVTIANLTIYNNYGSLYGDDNKHQFALRGAGTRIILLHCAILSDGGDALSLWDREDGMYYHADCDFAGWVDYVCPRGWCYIADSRFFGYNIQSASLWHDGSADKRQKFVIRNSTFDGRSGFPLGRNHRDGQVFLLHCRFSANMADRPFYLPPSSRAPWSWGDRHYYFDCHRDGGDYGWFADNIASADGSPDDSTITARWTFDGRWDPESHPPSVLPFAAFPLPRSGSRLKVTDDVMLRWTPGLDAVSQAVYFGTTDSPTLVAIQSTNSLVRSRITPGVTYYWRVDAITRQDTIKGPLWNFTLTN